MSARDEVLAAQFALGAPARTAHADVTRRMRRAPGFRGRVAARQVLLAGLARRVGDIRIGPGEFHLAPAGVQHPPITTDTGARFFIRGAS